MLPTDKFHSKKHREHLGNAVPAVPSHDPTAHVLHLHAYIERKAEKTPHSRDGCTAASSTSFSSSYPNHDGEKQLLRRAALPTLQNQLPAVLKHQKRPTGI